MAEENFRTVVSHDFTKKETWYQKSSPVVGETLTLVSGTTFGGVNTHWINLTSGLVFGEDTLSASYPIKIYDNGVEQTSGYTIDHVAGQVTFSVAPTGPVTADYYYGSDATFTISPLPGTVAIAKHAELDFTLNIQISTVNFEVWAYNPADLPNKVMVDKVTYKNMKDVIKVANEMTTIPPIGEITQEVVRAVFKYSRSIDLADSSGLEMRITVDNNTPFVGEFGSISVYVVDKNE